MSARVAQLRYFAHAADGLPLALLGFGAAAWKTAPRDRFIGWDPATRQRNLPLVVNHARYLILPWARLPCLASHLLARIQRQLPDDWQRRYNLRPALLETFCETPRFAVAKDPYPSRPPPEARCSPTASLPGIQLILNHCGDKAIR